MRRRGRACRRRVWRRGREREHGGLPVDPTLRRHGCWGPTEARGQKRAQGRVWRGLPPHGPWQRHEREHADEQRWLHRRRWQHGERRRGHRGRRLNRGVLLTVAYDGSLFSGFARQANARTIAGELQGAIRELDPRASVIKGASRTDKGVHARAQKVSFASALDISPRGWALGLRPHLPREIAIVSAARVDASFDPRRHARHKRYRYVLLRSLVPDPFWERRAWRIPWRLEETLMHREAAALVGKHDFAAFRAAADERAETVRTLTALRLSRLSDDARCIAIDVAGDHFLYNMVRIIVGSLVDVARGKLEQGACARALVGGSRGDLGMTAPAAGLCLEEVTLDDEGEDVWPSADALATL